MAEWSERHPLTKRDVEMYVPYSAGVYRLTNKVGEKQVVFYVGQGERLGEDIMNHVSHKESKECIKEHVGTFDCFFRFAESDSAEEREQMLKAQLEQYHPCCNA